MRATLIRTVVITGLLTASVVAGGVEAALGATASMTTAQGQTVTAPAVAPATESSSLQSRCYRSQSHGVRRVYCHSQSRSGDKVTTTTWVASGTQTGNRPVVLPASPADASIAAALRRLLQLVANPAH
jgi:hypothetical protein